MKKVILFLFLSTFSFSQIQNPTTCCYDNQVLYTSTPAITTSLPEILLEGVFYQRNPNALTEFYHALGGTDTSATKCEGVGINKRWSNVGYLNRRRDDVTQEWIEDDRIGVSQTTYTCHCDLAQNPDIPKPTSPSGYEEIYDGVEANAPTECYEPISPYLASDYQLDCEIRKVCYRQVQNCDDKGAEWEYNSAQDVDACFAWVDEDNYDSGDFTNNKCCLHIAPDVNNTPSPSISPSPSPTFDRSTCPDTNPICLAPMIPDPESCGCILSGTPDPTPTPTTSPTLTPTPDSTPNPTDEILDGISSKADSQLEKTDATNAILSGIKSDLQSQSATNHDDLSSVKSSVDDVKTSVDSASATNHSDLTKIDDTLGGIKEGTDALKELIDDGKSKEGDMLDATHAMENSVESAKGNYISVLDTFSGIASSYTNTPPVFTGSGDSSFSTTVYGSSIVFDFSIVANLRQYFEIFFSLLLAYLNFKIYLWIFRFLVKLGG